MTRNPGLAGRFRWPISVALALILAASAPALNLGAQDPAQKKDEPPKVEKKEEPKAEKKATKKRPERKEDPEARYNKMDYGQFLTASIKADGKDNNANKGIAIKLGSDKARPTTICYDTDLLRVSGAWTGGFLSLLGTPFDGSHGSWPQAKGTPIFSTKPGPGFAKGDDFKDPRPEPFGPLPADWAKFKGLYQSGDKVVLSYTVGDASVLEMPGIEDGEGDSPVITRTFNVGPTTNPVTMVVCDIQGDPIGPAPWKTSDVRTGVALRARVGEKEMETSVYVEGELPGAIWKVVDGSRCLIVLPASSKPTMFRLAITGPHEAGKPYPTVLPSKEPLDLTPFTKGGPAHWTQTVETKGTLGTGDGPYVVDTLTSPDENPYHSWMRFGGMDFFADGKSAALSTWSGDVWTVTGIDDTLEKLTWKRVATGLFQPLGLKIIDEKIYVLGRDGITRLNDLNGDGETDFYEAFNHDMAVTTGFHEFAFDLQTDPEGNFYFSKAGPVKSGGRGFDTIAANSGALMKVYKDGKTLVNYATGLRAPNGIGVGPDGQVTSGDNEGTWMPKCRLNWIKQGGFYGVVDLSHREDRPSMYDEPICWFPKDVDNSGGGQAWVTSDKWGPFSGRLLHTSYGTCSLFLALVDQQGDHIQGGVVRFPINFLTGIMRPRFNAKDGQLYVAGLRGWQTSAAADAAFQRVRYNHKPANMVTGLKVTKTGLDLTFTDPLDPEDATDPESFEIEQWNYLWCSEYGSDDYSAGDPDYQTKVKELNKLREDRGKNGKAIEELTKSFKKGHDEVKVASAKLSADGKTISLEIPDIKPVMQMKIRGKLKAADGKKVAVEVYNTINFVP